MTSFLAPKILSVRRYSAEEAFALLTLQPWVRISALPKKLLIEVF